MDTATDKEIHFKEGLERRLAEFTDMQRMHLLVLARRLTAWKFQNNSCYVFADNVHPIVCAAVRAYAAISSSHSIPIVATIPANGFLTKGDYSAVTNRHIQLLTGEIGRAMPGDIATPIQYLGALFQAVNPHIPNYSMKLATMHFSSYYDFSLTPEIERIQALIFNESASFVNILTPYKEDIHEFSKVVKEGTKLKNIMCIGEAKAHPMLGDRAKFMQGLYGGQLTDHLHSAFFWARNRKPTYNLQECMLQGVLAQELSTEPFVKAGEIFNLHRCSHEHFIWNDWFN